MQWERRLNSPQGELNLKFSKNSWVQINWTRKVVSLLYNNTHEKKSRRESMFYTFDTLFSDWCDWLMRNSP